MAMTLRPPAWLLTGVAGFLLGVGVTVITDRPTAEPDVDVAIPALEPAPSTTQRRTTVPTTTTTTTSAPRLGARTNPYAQGDSVVFSRSGQDQWQITVVGFQPDGSAAVAAENQFNDPPAPDARFALVTVEATYVGTDEPAILLELDFGAIDDNNVAYDYEDTCGVIPDEIDRYGDVYRGGTISGNLCWEVQKDSIDSLLLTVGSSGPGSPPTFFDLS
jgi:hypothetical protein